MQESGLGVEKAPGVVRPQAPPPGALDARPLLSAKTALQDVTTSGDQLKVNRIQRVLGEPRLSSFRKDRRLSGSEVRGTWVRGGMATSGLD